MKTLFSGVLTCLLAFQAAWRPVYTGQHWELVGTGSDFQTATQFGLQFDLVRLTARDDPATFLWAAVGVSQRDGRYLSLVAGLPTRDQLRQAFARPRPIRLAVGPPIAGPTGLDWDQCPAAHAAYCQIARLLELAAPPDREAPRPGPSNVLIQTGYTARHPMYGFLFWPVSLEAGPLEMTCQLPPAKAGGL